MADYGEILQLFETKLSQLSGLPAYVEYENIKVEIPKDATGMRTNLIAGPQSIETIGINPETRDDGIFQISVETQLWAGAKAANDLIRLLRSHFYIGLSLSKNNTGVRVRKFEQSPGIEDLQLQKYVIYVSVYFYSYSI
jgi:hypothetical protein